MKVGEVVTRIKRQWDREEVGAKVGTCHIN